jgi:glutathione S-transferase/GST-like protein
MISDQRQIAYGANRYTNETHRLYGVLNKRLADRDYVAGDYSIADMASWPWITPWRLQGIVMDEFPNLKAWYARIEAREAVQRSAQVGKDLTNRNLGGPGRDAAAARNVLFGQRAR